VLTRQRLLRLSVSAVALVGSSASLPAAAHADAVSQAVAARINGLRASHGLRRLAVDGRLIRAASSQSSAMMSRNKLAHGPTGSGETRLTHLCRRMGARTVGETIGWIRYRSPAAQAAGIVRWWMRSPPHRAALMSPTFSRIGVGRRTGRAAGGKVVWFTADLSG
jgi:uncharacterized protein YkwD